VHGWELDSTSSTDDEDEFHDALWDGGAAAPDGQEQEQEVLLSSMQAQALAEFRHEIRRLPVPLQEATLEHAATDADLLRFLRYQYFSVRKASTMLQTTVQWRASTPEVARPINWKPHRSIMRTGMSWLYGRDRQGRPLWQIRARLHQPSRSAEVVSCTLTMLEWIIATAMEPPVESCTLLFDLTGYGLKNYDLNWCYKIISACQSHYPYRLGNAIVVSAPMSFRGLWSTVQPFLDPETKARVLLLGSDYRGPLHALVDPVWLPPDLGGTARFDEIEYARVLAEGGSQREAETAAEAAAEAAA
jgi:hypothetical protein